MKIALSVMLLGLSLGLAGCQTYDAADDIAAIIVEPGDASRAELQQVVNNAMGTTVTLADDALTRSSTLTIEQGQPSSMQNPRPQGRVLDMPTRFVLVSNRGSCFLIDQRDGSRFLLESTRCAAE